MLNGAVGALPPVDPREPGLVLFVPSMDPFAAPLAAAVFRSAGFDARVVVENARTLSLGMQHTGGGECVPCPSTTGALIHAMQQSGCRPEKAVFFMPGACGPCRFGQYACLNRLVFDNLGWQAVRILSPSADNAYSGLSSRVRMRLWHAVLIADILRKMGMRVRPYETQPGATDRIIGVWLGRFVDVFAARRFRGVSRLLSEAVRAVNAIPVDGGQKPLVGVVGEIYVRCNPFLNNEVCRKIEELGGEVSLAPVAEWIAYTNCLKAMLARVKYKGAGGVFRMMLARLEHRLFFCRLEHHYYGIADPVLQDRREPPIADVIAAGSRYLPERFTGESILTLGRAVLFITRDRVQAVVNVNPVFCMPGTITTSIFPAIEREFGVPVICNFYDGSANRNQSLVPVMHVLRNQPLPRADAVDDRACGQDGMSA